MTTLHGGDALFPRATTNANSTPLTLSLTVPGDDVIETSKPPKASLFQSFRTKNTLWFLRDPERHWGKPDLNHSIPFDIDFEMGRACAPVLDQLTEEILGKRRDQVSKPSSWTKVHETASVLMFNLLRAYGVGPSCFLAISQRNGDYVIGRYHRRVSLYNLRRVQDYFEERGWIEVHPGYLDRSTGCGRVTRVRLTRSFHQWLLEAGKGIQGFQGIHLSLSSSLITGKKPHSLITTSEDSEVIILRNEVGQDIDYEDDVSTLAMRERLRSWNRFQSGFWIDLLVRDGEIQRMMSRVNQESISKGWEADQKRQCLDLSQRTLRRIFNVTFDQGGRFYGGWWQQVPSAFRQFITIDGQPTVELDFKGMHIAMLYAQIGQPLAAGEEPYAVPGVGDEHRKLIKAVLLKMLNAGQGQRIDPPVKKGTRDPVPLPTGMTWKSLQEAVAHRHEPIRRFFRSGDGVRVQRIDSDIAETIMLRLMNQGILALPIHDSFVTTYRHADVLRQTMLAAYREHVGVDVGIKADPSLIDGLQSVTEEAVGAFMDERASTSGYEGYRWRRDEFRRWAMAHRA